MPQVNIYEFNRITKISFAKRMKGAKKNPKTQL